MDSPSAVAARRIREQRRARVKDAQREHERISHDTNFSDEGRTKALEPLVSSLQAAHDATARELAKLQEPAEQAVAYYWPSEARRRAAALAPAKAASGAELAKLEDAKGLISTARTAVGAKDFATARGLELGLRSRTDLSAEDRDGIFRVLDEPHRAQAHVALAVLVGVKTEIQRHATEGAFGDAFAALLSDPARVIQAIRSAQSYTHPDTGARVYLNDKEAAQLLDDAGVLSDIGVPEPAGVA